MQNSCLRITNNIKIAMDGAGHAGLGWNRCDIRCHMAGLAAVEARMALVATLGTDARSLHDPMNPVMAAGLCDILHILGDVAIAIGKTTFNPELLDLAK